jgi:hypothetical protein
MSEIGKDTTFFQWLSGVFSRQKTTTPVRTTEPKSTYRDLSSVASWSDLASWYSSAMKDEVGRTAKYQLYRFLDENLAEASTALNIYADNVVSGTIGGEENYSIYIGETVPNKEGIEKIVKDFEMRTGIKDQVWDISRDLTRDGDVFQEVVIEQVGDRVRIAKFKDLPTAEVFNDVDERGVVRNPDFPYYQLPTQTVSLGGVSGGRINFEWWRLIHLKIGRRTYGVDRSLFGNAAKRLGRQLIMIDDALVMARLSRAVMRYVFTVDVQGIPPDDRFAYVQKFMNQIKRKEVIDRSSGKLNILDAPWSPDDDIGIPTEPGVNQGVSAIGGDTNITNIADVLYLRDKFFGVLTIPKAYASIEEGTRSRATLDKIDVQFARQTRRKQACLVPGIRRMYELEFYLNGIDPESFEWEVEFPELATSDEMAMWEMMNLKAAVAKSYVLDIGVLNNDWILYEVLGFDEKEVKKYAAIKQEVLPPEAQSQTTPSAGSQFIPAEMKQRILKDPYFRQTLEDLRDMVQNKIIREKRLEGKVPIGISRTLSLRNRWED